MTKNFSNIELYYSPQITSTKNIIISEDEDYKHIVKVMRHSTGDEIYISDGVGKIFKSKISFINKNYLEAEIEETFSYKNKFSNITFCIPKLKSQDRFEFALEKCVELGITNFIVFNSERTITKGNKTERWERILISAMKQSLRSFLPKISIANSLAEILELDGDKIIFEQNSAKKFLSFENNYSKNYYFIFGPEGGLSENELNLFSDEEKFSLSSNRLRSETAIIKCASMLS